MNEWKPDLIFTTRIFSNGSWDEGGRLFGDEFQNQPKSERSKILINNQPVSEIDISNCHATMAFADARVDWFANHSQDLYQIQQMGYWPREVVKKAFSIVLNVDNETSAIKALVREATREYWSFAYEQVDRPKWYRNLIADMRLVYPEIAPHFFKARGMYFMCREGEIALLVIKECLRRKIPVLALHDSYIMPSQYSVPVTDIVKSAFERVVGVNCIVR